MRPARSLPRYYRRDLVYEFLFWRLLLRGLSLGAAAEQTAAGGRARLLLPEEPAAAAAATSTRVGSDIVKETHGVG